MVPFEGTWYPRTCPRTTFRVGTSDGGWQVRVAVKTVGEPQEKIKKSVIFFNVEIYCVITTALWSRDGSAVVISLHPPAASMVSSVRFL